MPANAMVLSDNRFGQFRELTTQETYEVNGGMPFILGVLAAAAIVVVAAVVVAATVVAVGAVCQAVYNAITGK